MRSRCTVNPKGRCIERTDHAHLIDRNAQRIAADPEAYRKRQSIVEHPFGTMKRQWGFDHIMTKKTLHHAAADVGLIFIAYNLRRMFNLIPEAFKNGGKCPDKGFYGLIYALLGPTAPLWMQKLQTGAVPQIYHNRVPNAVFRHF